MNGILSEKQRAIVGSIVQGRTVADLGAGTGVLARELLVLGSERVYVVDKPELAPYYNHPRLEKNLGWFEENTSAYEVVFASWPPQYGMRWFADIVRRAGTVVYLGANYGGVVCGPSDFWEHVLKREVLHHEPHPRNVLSVYGGRLVAPCRAPLPEERAALDQAKIYSYEDLYGKEGRHEHGDCRTGATD